MSLRTKICNWLLLRKIARISRKQRFVNLNNAQNVGVIFDATHQSLVLTSNKFIESLQQEGKKVTGLGYVDTKQAIGYFDEYKHLDFFWINDCNWFCKPKSVVVTDFCNSKFDLLIDLTSANIIQLKYIIGISQAQLKIGRDVINKNLYDFILKIGEDKKLSYYIEQIRHYLSIIKQ